MIWLTWRQFRAQAITAAVALAVVAIVVAATGPGIASAYTSSGLAACHAGCATDASNFFTGLGRLDLLLYFGSFLLMYLAPALMGIFWGAPLIAREVETGTHRVAWNQSVTRTRWVLVKLGLVALAAVATAGLLSLMVTWWASPINHAALLSGGQISGLAPRLDAPVFDARGVVPLGYAAFAFALGVTAGVLLRRTLPAMAVTLVAFAVIQVLVPNLVRPHLLPPDHFTVPLNFSGVGVNMNASTGQVSIQLAGPLAKPGAWVLSDVITTSSGAQLPNVTITPSGAELTVPPRGCTLTPGTGGFGGCKNVLAAMHLRESVSYQPASRFWPLQWTETGIYLVLAAGLGWACVAQLRRRRTA
jgi:ABC-2 family transporter protein